MNIVLVGPKSKEGGMSRYVKDILEKNTKDKVTLFNTFHGTKNRVSFMKTSYSTMINSGLQRAFLGIIKSLLNLISFPLFVKRQNPDIVHLCGVSFAPFWERALYVIISKIMGKKTFLHYLGSFDQFYFSSSNFSQFLIRESLKQVDVIGVLSKKTMTDMTSFIDHKRIHLIPSSVNMEHVQKREFNNNGKLRILFVAGSHPYRKGIDDIIKILPSVVEKNNNTCFIFSGSPTVKKVIGKLDEKIQKNNIKFIGWFTEESKWSMYNSADILLLPSYNEGLPYVIIEALASGLPIISTSVGGIPEVVIDGENGFIIKPGDSDSLETNIVKLSNDHLLREKISKCNSNKARKHYSLENNINLISQIYRQMAGTYANT